MVVWVTNNSFMLLGNRSFHTSVKGSTSMSQLISYDIDYFLDEVFSENKGGLFFCFVLFYQGAQRGVFENSVSSIATFFSFQIPKDPKYLSSASKIIQVPACQLGGFLRAMCLLISVRYPQPNTLDEVFSVLYTFLQFTNTIYSLDHITHQQTQSVVPPFFQQHYG